MLQYIILGTIQGIFEWLPISSEGVVVLASQFMLKEANPIDSALFLHLGTLLAAIIYFRKDWKKLLAKKNSDLSRFLISATMVSLVVGYPIYRVASNITIGASLLLITGIGLLFTAYFHKIKRGQVNLDFTRLGILVGILQGLAAIPGFSRSGSTIFGLSFGKFSPTEILKISYMMSAPIVLVSSLYLILKNPVIVSAWPSLVASFVIGLASLSVIMKASLKINFYKFALLFAAFCFIGAIIGFLL